MSIERLVEMANDIGAYFAVEKDEAAAIEGIRAHLERFWEPRMRRRIIEYLARDGGKELAPRVRAAVAALQPPPARRSTAGAAAG